MIKRTMNLANRYKRNDKSKSGSRCRMCGQFIENGEEYYFLITNGLIQDELIEKEKLVDVQNYLIHADEFESVEKETYLEKIIHIYKEKVPKANNKMVENKQVTGIITEIFKELDYRILSENQNTIIFKNSDKFRFKYHKRHRYIDFLNRINRGLFGNIFIDAFNEKISTKFYKKAHENGINELIYFN